MTNGASGGPVGQVSRLNRAAGSLRINVRNQVVQSVLETGIFR
jgi:hypothetical protein